jgi:hypothetical protein
MRCERERDRENRPSGQNVGSQSVNLTVLSRKEC